VPELELLDSELTDELELLALDRLDCDVPELVELELSELDDDDCDVPEDVDVLDRLDTLLVLDSDDVLDRELLLLDVLLELDDSS
jgi:hypothetical protein